MRQAGYIAIKWPTKGKSSVFSVSELSTTIILDTSSKQDQLGRLNAFDGYRYNGALKYGMILRSGEACWEVYEGFVSSRCDSVAGSSVADSLEQCLLLNITTITIREAFSSPKSSSYDDVLLVRIVSSPFQHPLKLNQGFSEPLF
jgi:hypothetical protein